VNAFVGIAKNYLSIAQCVGTMIRDKNGRNALFYLLYHAWKDDDFLTAKHADIGRHILDSKWGSEATAPDNFGVTPLQLINDIASKSKDRMRKYVKTLKPDEQKIFKENLAKRRGDDATFLDKKVVKIQNEVGGEETKTICARHYMKKGRKYDGGKTLPQIAELDKDKEGRDISAMFWQWREHEEAISGLQALLTVTDREYKAKRVLKAKASAGIMTGLLICSDLIWTVIFKKYLMFVPRLAFKPFQYLDSYVAATVSNKMIQIGLPPWTTFFTSGIIWFASLALFLAFARWIYTKFVRGPLKKCCPGLGY